MKSVLITRRELRMFTSPLYLLILIPKVILAAAKMISKPMLVIMNHCLKIPIRMVEYQILVVVVTWTTLRSWGIIPQHWK